MTDFSFPLITIAEGAAKLQIPDMNQYRVPTEAPVFYNFLMEMNRDITILAVRAYQERLQAPLKILLPLAATGVRGIRLQLELSNIEKIIMNDSSAEAWAMMKRNLELNQLTEIEVSNNDAISFLADSAKRGQRADVVDVDPFGSPSRFMDVAIRAVKKKAGMICLTATDMAPLCGVGVEACLRKYGARPLRTEYCHELAVRICLNALIRTAARYEIAIQPLLCYSIDHYIRIYALLEAGALKADAILKQLGYIVHCFTCDHRFPTKNLLPISSICPNCGDQLDYAGPLWLGQVFDIDFCQQLSTENARRNLGTKKRIVKMLEFISQEVAGPITYHNVHRICRQYKKHGIGLQKLLERLQEAGFFASRTHFSRISIRTNASRDQIAQLIP